jgi:hypothetical protein
LYFGKSNKMVSCVTSKIINIRTIRPIEEIISQLIDIINTNPKYHEIPYFLDLNEFTNITIKTIQFFSVNSKDLSVVSNQLAKKSDEETEESIESNLTRIDENSEGIYDNDESDKSAKSSTNPISWSSIVKGHNNQEENIVDMRANDQINDGVLQMQKLIEELNVQELSYEEFRIIVHKNREICTDPKLQCLLDFYYNNLNLFKKFSYKSTNQLAQTINIFYSWLIDNNIDLCDERFMFETQSWKPDYNQYKQWK